MPGGPIHLREQPLPGVGQRFEIDLNDGRQLVVVTARGGGRSLAVTDPAAVDADASQLLLELSSEEAVVLGALLLGVRFSFEASIDDRSEGTTVIVQVVAVADGAPSVGRSVGDMLAPIADEAVVLGVVKDRTPEIVEADNQAPLEVGDRVVVAMRAARAAAVLDLLSGP